MSQSSSSKHKRSSTDATGSFRILSDVASSENDYLDFGPYAEALAFLIDQKDTNTPLIAAISAPWGAGKTTLARLVRHQLRTRGEWDEPHIICQFNAWKHDDAPNLGAAFAAHVAQRANQYRHWWRRLIDPLPAAMLSPEQRWRRKLWVILASLAVAIALVLGPNTRAIITAAAQPTNKNWTSAEHAAHGLGLTLLVFVAALAFIYPRIFSGTKAIARFINDPRSEAARGSIDSVRKQLGQLIHSATRGRRRFVVFIDDLERCRPPRAVEVCEVASQLLDHKDVVTVLIADMDTIARSAAIKYRALELPGSGDADTGAYDEYGRAYLQKLVQLQFDLPPATAAQLTEMLLVDQRTAAGGAPPAAAGGSEAGQQQTAAEPDMPDGSSRAFAPLKSGAALGSVVSVIAAISSAVIAFYSLGGGTQSTKHVPDTLIIVSSAIFAAYLVGIVFTFTRRRIVQRARNRIDQKIKAQSAGTTIDQAVANISPTERSVSRASIRRQYFGVVLADLESSGIRNRVDSLVCLFLPERPRGAKRLLNQVRLMLPIAIARELFGLQEGPSMEPVADRFSKWLVLRERWPEVALVGQHDSSAITSLENCAREVQDSPWLAELDKLHLADIADMHGLRRLLQIDPRFGDISDLAFVSIVPSEAVNAGVTASA